MGLKKKFRRCLDKMTKNNNKEKPEDFKFISERPKDGGLLFGHDTIVETLEKIVLKSPESFTIGIYGGWGSGKSSIAETLQSNLKNYNIPLIIFDVWKHEGDALRRTFLKDLDKKLASKYFGKEFYKEKFELEKNIDRQVTGVISSGYKLEWQKLFRHVLIIVGFFAVIVFALSGLIWLANKIFSFESESNSNFLEIATLFIGGISVPVIYWFKYFNSFIKENKEEYTKPQFQDPIEFENSFHSILNNLTDDVKKIVIVFDNLDRVSGKKAVKIISTIKTFLEPADKNNIKDIVFIIPCDSQAIKKHLEKVFGNHEDNYADEFLRKFFNTIVWVPEFYSTELQKLASEKLAETKVSDLNNIDLASLITIVFDQNPRQIIQFINILLANYLLLREQKISGFLIKDNVTQLAKYLLLKQKFPKIMDAFRELKIYNLSDGL
ncbi:MAG: P-loop NTPase fold protein [Allomuricauda sp.]